jgi:hypothetical protein
MIGGQRIRVGLPHAGKTAEVTVGTDTVEIMAEPGIVITTARTSSRVILRHKGSTCQPAGATGHQR